MQCGFIWGVILSKLQLLSDQRMIMNGQLSA